MQPRETTLSIFFFFFAHSYRIAALHTQWWLPSTMKSDTRRRPRPRLKMKMCAFTIYWDIRIRRRWISSHPAWHHHHHLFSECHPSMRVHSNAHTRSNLSIIAFRCRPDEHLTAPAMQWNCPYFFCLVDLFARACSLSVSFAKSVRSNTSAGSTNVCKKKKKRNLNNIHVLALAAHSTGNG